MIMNNLHIVLRDTQGFNLLPFDELVQEVELYEDNFSIRTGLKVEHLPSLYKFAQSILLYVTKHISGQLTDFDNHVIVASYSNLKLKHVEYRFSDYRATTNTDFDLYAHLYFDAKGDVAWDNEKLTENK